MSALNAAAKAALRDAGISQADWARDAWSDGKWHGDACGCTDDRCIGYHHYEHEECGCLPVLIDSYLTARGRRARVSGPYETEGEAASDPEVRVVYAAFDADPGAGKMAPHSLAMLTRALDAAGVELGAYDRRIAEWLAGWEPATVAVICGWVSRARAQGGAR